MIDSGSKKYSTGWPLNPLAVLTGCRLDIFYWAILLALVYLFYYPATGPQFFRYLYYADLYERFGSLVNPEYGDKYFRYPWEQLYPLSTLIYGTIYRITGNLWYSILIFHMSMITIATFLTYLLTSRLTTQTIAFLITATIVFGRVHLGLARGLGCTHTLLIYPICLGLVCMLLKQYKNGDFRLKTSRIVLGSLLFALGISLGGHESLTFIVFYALTILIYGAVVFLQNDLGSLKRYLFGLGMLAALGVVLWMLLSYLIYLNIPNNQRNAYGDIVLLTWHLKGAFKDITAEHAMGINHYLKVLAGAFLHGEYLTKLGSHHANTFLPKGVGFNGVIPLYCLVGILIVVSFAVLNVLKNGKGYLLNSLKKMSLFCAFISAMLLLFVATMLTTSDPKPTRIFLSVYAVYYLGYYGIVVCLKRFTSFYRYILVLMCLVFTFQIGKNYIDLNSYYEVYKAQVPLKVMSQAASGQRKHDNILSAASANNGISHNRSVHPAVGLVQGYEDSPKP